MMTSNSVPALPAESWQVAPARSAQSVDLQVAVVDLQVVVEDPQVAVADQQVDLQVAVEDLQVEEEEVEGPQVADLLCLACYCPTSPETEMKDMFLMTHQDFYEVRDKFVRPYVRTHHNGVRRY